jgi:hypothetical protein
MAMNRKCTNAQEIEIDLDAIQPDLPMTREAALAAQRRAISEAETERADRRQARALRDRALLREIEQHPSTLGDRVVIQTEPFSPSRS